MDSGVKKINVIIADDHELLRSGLKLVLKEIPRIDKIFEAKNGEEVLVLVEREFIDLIFMDISMKVMDGLTTTLKLREKNNPVKIIALSYYDDAATMRGMYLAGCDGYIVKELFTIEEVIIAIEKVLSGGKYFSDIVTKKIIYDSEDTMLTTLKEKHKLNEQELEVLKLLCKGLTTKEIALALYKSERSIEDFRKFIHDKTQTKNVAELIAFAHRFHIIKLDRL